MTDPLRYRLAVLVTEWRTRADLRPNEAPILQRCAQDLEAVLLAGPATTQDEIAMQRAETDVDRAVTTLITLRHRLAHQLAIARRRVRAYGHSRGIPPDMADHLASAVGDISIGEAHALIDRIAAQVEPT